MGTFIADGATVLPTTKVNARLPHIPIANYEWAAGDTNQIREALLDLRTYVLGLTPGGLADPVVGTITPGTLWTLNDAASVVSRSALSIITLQVDVTAGVGADWDSPIATITTDFVSFLTPMVCRCAYRNAESEVMGQVTINTDGTIVFDGYIDGTGFNPVSGTVVTGTQVLFQIAYSIGRNV